MIGAGIAPKPKHYAHLLADPQPPAFIEVHAENFLGAGGEPHASLRALRDCFPLSIHGVGLSIGGEGALDARHVDRVAALLERYQPETFSEHLAWSSHGLNNFNDLLPLVYDEASLQRVCDHVDQLQSRFGRRILLENPATYVEFIASSMAEGEFLGAVVQRTGCGLLLDVNNVAVSAHNLGFDADAYLADFPVAAVGEVHLAGYTPDGATDLLIDGHNAPIANDVWALYAAVVARIGACPTLIERDADLPPFAELLDERNRAAALLQPAQFAVEHA